MPASVVAHNHHQHRHNAAPPTPINTKTPVREMKRRLGILGDPEGEDKWAQFNRASKWVYDCHMHGVDVNKTWLELSYDLRRTLINAVYVEFPPDWKSRHDRTLLEHICNTRLFRLHHLSRLRSNRSDGSGLGDDEETDEDSLGSTPPGPISPTRLLPYDPVRHF